MNPRETGGCYEGAAQNPAQFYPQPPTPDGELAEVIEAWPYLPDAVRKAVLGLVRSAAGESPAHDATHP